jgi:hypothetical protein
VSPDALVDLLRARGVTLEIAGDRLKITPASAVTPDELAMLRARKAEVLRLLAGPPPRPIPDLDPRVVCDHFGLPLPAGRVPAAVATKALADAMLTGTLDPKAVSDLHEQVLAAVCELEWEINAGTLKRTPRLVQGRPLADFLDLDTVARLLREGKR